MGFYYVFIFLATPYPKVLTGAPWRLAPPHTCLLGPHLDQAGLGAQVFIVPEALKVYLAGKAGIIGGGSQLHLETECQVILPVRILQVLNGAFRRLAQSVKEHNLRRIPAVHLGNQMQVLPHSVPVDI